MIKIHRHLGASILSAAITAPIIVSAQIPDVGSLQAKTNLPLSDFMSIFSGVMQWGLAVVAVLAVIAFVVSGILYLTAAGDEQQIARARRAFFGAVMGVIVALIGLIVIQAAQQMLNAQSSF